MAKVTITSRNNQSRQIKTELSQVGDYTIGRDINATEPLIYIKGKDIFNYIGENPYVNPIHSNLTITASQIVLIKPFEQGTILSRSPEGSYRVTNNLLLTPGEKTDLILGKFPLEILVE